MDTYGLADDVFPLSGSAQVSSSAGRPYSYTIIEPLKAACACKEYLEGVIEVTWNENEPVTIDFDDVSATARYMFRTPGKGYSAGLFYWTAFLIKGQSFGQFHIETRLRAGTTTVAGVFYENPATVPNPEPQSSTRIIMFEKRSLYFPPLFFKSFRQF